MTTLSFQQSFIGFFKYAKSVRFIYSVLFFAFWISAPLFMLSLSGMNITAASQVLFENEMAKTAWLFAVVFMGLGLLTAILGYRQTQKSDRLAKKRSNILWHAHLTFAALSTCISYLLLLRMITF